MATTIPANPIEEIFTPLCGVLLYEDREAHARALNLYAYLATEVAREIPLEFSWWAFPTSHDTTHARAARNAVATADVVIVAAKAAADWPSEFKTWIESWALPKSKRLSALGAMLSPGETSGVTVCGRQAYLQYVAARQKLDFLAAAPDATAQLMKTKLGLSSAPKAVPPGPNDISDHPVYSPYCGING
jgi:hypothetical protein